MSTATIHIMLPGMKQRDGQPDIAADRPHHGAQLAAQIVAAPRGFIELAESEGSPSKLTLRRQAAALTLRALLWHNKLPTSGATDVGIGAS